MLVPAPTTSINKIQNSKHKTQNPKAPVFTNTTPTSSGLRVYTHDP